jgi:probable HAF family extracellular repeat protein
MKHEFHFYRSALATAVLLGHAGLALAADYTITDLGTLGGSSSYAYGINSLGAVVGWANTASGDQHAFLYSNGVMSDLGTLGGSISEARAINDQGQVVGSANTADGVQQPFLYSGGVMSSLGASGTATGINNNGQMIVNGNITPDGYDTCLAGTGSCLATLANAYGTQSFINNNNQVAINSHIAIDKVAVNSSLNSYAYLFNDGTLNEFQTGIDNLVTDVGSLGGGSRVTAINDHGEVVGYSITADFDVHAFLYSGGAMSDLGTLGDLFSIASSINNKGQVVGFTLNTSQGFLYSDGKMQKLSDLLPDGSGWSIDVVDLNTLGGYDINDSGQIAGTGLINGEAHAFLMTPVPVPAALWLFGSGLLGLTGLARSRKK